MLPQDPLVELFVGMALAGLEGELLLGHGLGVELGEGVGGAAEGGVERAVGLVQARRGLRLPLPGHRRRRRSRGWSRANRGGELDRRVCGLLALPICFPLEKIAILGLQTLTTREFATPSE